MGRLEFDWRLVERLEQLYATRDVLRRRELVRAALCARAGDRVLDIGCGPGFYVTSLPDASFDRAVAVQVLEYVQDIPAALAEMYRALRPSSSSRSVERE